ncbi:MAG: sigma-70 family RNA polymerase sigma factor [Candidatus Edwardsbacteria bacterium]|jgi:RNA polymerase sigma-70 factor (ECF subfamily)|nr:sigma-70 family RNA polymerase sigma factor [Candidatus Edwardsbacteria bacterium]
MTVGPPHLDGTDAVPGCSNLVRAAGDAKPDFDRLVGDAGRRLYNLLLRLCGDHHYAQDLTQDVLLIAWREYGKFRGECDIFTWLYRIAVNHHRRFQRRMRFSRWLGLSELGDDDERLAADDPAAAERGERQDKVAAAVAALPRDFRETIVLFYYQDQDCRRIAEIVGCSEGTVKSRLWRGRRMLAGKLKGYYQETEG